MAAPVLQLIPTPRMGWIGASAIAAGCFVLSYFALPISRETGEYADLRPRPWSRKLIDYFFSAMCGGFGLLILFGRNETFMSVSLIVVCIVAAAQAVDLISSGRVGIKFGAVVERDRNPILFWMTAALILIYIGAILISGVRGLYQRL